MTRINVVPPSELVDKHLLAEYRELPRVFRLARRCADAPREYTLGHGHVKFFYDKLLFLTRRFEALVVELGRRGFTVNYPNVVIREHVPELYNDYEPTTAALELNRARLRERLEKMTDVRRTPAQAREAA